ncbi:hypothetical protein APR12_002071 [Nocardia amikacinitolerans]|nr:hypothetical protein [Nocardia amikacinitolerans]
MSDRFKEDQLYFCSDCKYGDRNNNKCLTCGQTMKHIGVQYYLDVSDVEGEL